MFLLGVKEVIAPRWSLEVKEVLAKASGRAERKPYALLIIGGRPARQHHQAIPNWQLAQCCRAGRSTSYLFTFLLFYLFTLKYQDDQQQEQR